jgi:hypothetical protein
MSEYTRIWNKYQEMIKPIETQRDLEIKEMQDTCSHRESQWVHTFWAPGHQGADILECKRCGKNLTPNANKPVVKRLEKKLKCPNCDSDDIDWEDPTMNQMNRAYNKQHPYDPIIGAVMPYWRECKKCGCQFLQDKDGTVKYSPSWTRHKEQAKIFSESIKKLKEDKSK